MSAQPEEEGRVHAIGNPSIPQFEGLPVHQVRAKISGLSSVDAEDLPVFTVDDRVRLIGEFKCIAVRHIADPKTGDVIREQVLVPIMVDVCPFDPDDPADDGVVRARRIS